MDTEHLPALQCWGSPSLPALCACGSDIRANVEGPSGTRAAPVPFVFASPECEGSYTLPSPRPKSDCLQFYPHPSLIPCWGTQVPLLCLHPSILMQVLQQQYIGTNN